MDLNSVNHWFWENLVAIVAVGISVWAVRKSSIANQIAQEANDLVKFDLEYARDRDKTKKMKEIINTIVVNWSKPRGAQGALYDEWLIHKEDNFTIEDFNWIWKMAFQKVKGRLPRETAEEIIAKMDE